MFIENGYAETNMSDIAAAVGIKRPALHYYFRTKDRLFRAIYGEIIQSVISRIHFIIASDKPLLERISDIIDEYFELFMRNPVMPQFVVGETRRDMSNLIHVAKEMGIDKYIDGMKAELTSEIEKGTIRNVPTHIILFTFISQMVFPFMTQNLVDKVIPEEAGGFEGFLKEWKRSLMIQMGCLLSRDGNRDEVVSHVDSILRGKGEA